MTYKYDTLVFIGRMQPLHKGHTTVINKALELAKEVVVVLGSSFQPRSIKNPFTFKERKDMIDSVYSYQFTLAGAQGRIKLPRVKVVGVMDYPYDDNAWVSAVQTKVNKIVDENSKIGLIGHSKDHTSFYLRIFPDWKDHVEVENVDNVNATDIRNIILNYKWKHSTLAGVLDPQTYNSVHNAIYADNYGSTTDLGEDLISEFTEVSDYKTKSEMKGFSFDSVFVTTDAVITQSGYILLIKRGKFPFKGCWALPGGFLAKNTRILDNMIKELVEETRIKVPAKVIRGSIKNSHIFDHPDRDPRGRFITHGFHADLGYPVEGLPKVKGADDADEARWFHLSEVTSEMMAFDHYHIIKHFIPTY